MQEPGGMPGERMRGERARPSQGLPLKAFKGLLKAFKRGFKGLEGLLKVRILGKQAENHW